MYIIKFMYIYICILQVIMVIAIMKFTVWWDWSFEWKGLPSKGFFLDGSDEMPAPIPFWIVFSTAKYSIHMHPIQVVCYSSLVFVNVVLNSFVIFNLGFRWSKLTGAYFSKWVKINHQGRFQLQGGHPWVRQLHLDSEKSPRKRRLTSSLKVPNFRSFGPATVRRLVLVVCVFFGGHRKHVTG